MAAFRASSSITAGDTANLLDWTYKQGRVLTGGGVADNLFTAERGFPFEDSQLPHFHLMGGTTRETFKNWRSSGKVAPLVCGVWNRTLFMGGMEHSSDAEEIVFNTQTQSMFIDLRIPRLRPPFAEMGHKSIKTLSSHELRLFARQHCFCGYSLLDGGEPEGRPPVVTRHHIIDWNFIGAPRSRPNKWRVEMGESGDAWKEWAFATDDFGQSYYMERWERRAGDACGEGRVVALRTKSKSQGVSASSGSIGRSGGGEEEEEAEVVLLVVGDHFSFVRGRVLNSAALAHAASAGAKSLVELVDGALSHGDRELAEAFLGLEGGHGRVVDGEGSSGSCNWVVDAATHPWQEGRPCAELISAPSSQVSVVVSSGTDTSTTPAAAAANTGFLDWEVGLGGRRWEVLESSFRNPEALACFLRRSCEGSRKSAAAAAGFGSSHRSLL